jgi:hypothetical protein
MASAAARERYARKNEAADLKRAFNALDAKGDGKVDVEELNALFVGLGHKPKRGEVEDLIWEVDEDCDGCIGCAEFQRMYHRCRQDSTGLCEACVRVCVLLLWCVPLTAAAGAAAANPRTRTHTHTTLTDVSPAHATHTHTHTHARTGRLRAARPVQRV